MPLLEKSDLRYDYSWKVSAEDNPKLIHEDAKHLSRKEGYEMLTFLNGISFSEDKKSVVYRKGADMAVNERLYVEWMLKEHLESTAPGRETVTAWVNENWRSLAPKFKALKPKK